MPFQQGIFAYKNILIDTDLEPDDKAALDEFFKALHAYSKIHPEYLYPNITIIAGSSAYPIIKQAATVAILRHLTTKGFIPSTAQVKVIRGCSTDRYHENDGAELLTEPFRYHLIHDAQGPFESANNAIKQFLTNINNEESVYVALREVYDLKEGAQSLERFNNVDFMGTLSFNIRKIYPDASKFSSEILSKFRHALCYDNYNSACQNSSTSPIWGDSFKNHLESVKGALIKRAGEIWDEGNLNHYTKPFLSLDEISSMGLSDEQANKIHKLFAKTREAAKNNTLTMTQAEFTSLFHDIVGKDLASQIYIIDSKVSKVLKPLLGRFCSMIFHAPQICLADVAFMGLICNPDLLSSTMVAVDITSEGKCANNPHSSTYYVRMNKEQLEFLGTKVTETLSLNPTVPQTAVIGVFGVGANQAAPGGHSPYQFANGSIGRMRPSTTSDSPLQLANGSIGRMRPSTTSDSPLQPPLRQKQDM